MTNIKHIQTYQWIKKIISSCRNIEHLKTTERVVENFKSMLITESPDEYWNTFFYDLILPLEEKMGDKRNELFVD